MLTSSMNSSDLLRILSADHERIIRWGQYRIKEMRSELLRGMKDKIWKYFDYHTDNADYIIVIHCNRAGKFGIIRFAYIKETNHLQLNEKDQQERKSGNLWCLLTISKFCQKKKHLNYMILFTRNSSGKQASYDE